MLIDSAFPTRTRKVSSSTQRHCLNATSSPVTTVWKAARAQISASAIPAASATAGPRTAFSASPSTSLVATPSPPRISSMWVPIPASETDVSDFVGLIGVTSPNGLAVSLSGRFDENNGEMRLMAVKAGWNTRPVSVSARYAFIQAQPLYGFVDDRQELTLSASTRFNENWSAFASGTHDFVSDQLGCARRLAQYDDECFTYAMTYSEIRPTGVGQERDRTIGFNVSFRTPVVRNRLERDPVGQGRLLGRHVTLSPNYSASDNGDFAGQAEGKTRYEDRFSDIPIRPRRHVSGNDGRDAARRAGAGKRNRRQQHGHHELRHPAPSGADAALFRQKGQASRTNDRAGPQVLRNGHGRHAGSHIAPEQVNGAYANFASSNKLKAAQLDQILNQAGVTAKHMKNSSGCRWAGARCSACGCARAMPAAA